MAPVTNCRHFSGYKPCGLSTTCDDECIHKSVPRTRVLLVHLGALGAVLRSTALLPAIRRKFSGCHITWVTQAPAHQLLQFNPFVDRVLTTSSEDLQVLQGLAFDVGFCIDKSLLATALCKGAQVDFVYGFSSSTSGTAILPTTSAADELWRIGLNDELKFKFNQKPETQLVAEALELDYKRDEYVLNLTVSETEESLRRRQLWGGGSRRLIGINTGCSGAVPYKKLTVDGHLQMIERILDVIPSIQIVLLGGREDSDRNLQIMDKTLERDRERVSKGQARLSGRVLRSPSMQGIRDGLVSTAAVDMVVTGDSLGMHMAIALKKWTIAWFGPTCAQEIDLFDRGVKVLSNVTCGPCWKKSCDLPVKCQDQVDWDEVVFGVQQGLLFSGPRAFDQIPRVVNL